MKNFIRFNIENVKGKHRPPLLIEKQHRYYSPNKHNYHQVKSKLMSLERSGTKVSAMEDQYRKLQSQLYERYQNRIVNELNEIKSDVKMIKSLLFGDRRGSSISNNPEEKDIDEQSTIYENRKLRIKSFASDTDTNDHPNRNTIKTNFHEAGLRRVYRIQDLLAGRSGSNHSKMGVSIKNILPMTRDYKLEGPEFGTIFYGYIKRNSQPIAIKYSQEGLNHTMQIYERLWKNIAKAPWPCINKVYDLKSEEYSILVMQKNKRSIVGLPYQNVLMDIVQILEFIHDCGYLYKNIEPEHFMLNDKDQLVVIDFKRAKRYIDIKGHSVEVLDSIYTGSPFASNNQVRGLQESRKDDLESVGYLALLLLQMEIPWAGMNKEQVIKVRSGLTLQDLYKQQPQWISYMAYVARLTPTERPDYSYLCQLIGSQ